MGQYQKWKFQQTERAFGVVQGEAKTKSGLARVTQNLEELSISNRKRLLPQSPVVAN